MPRKLWGPWELKEDLTLGISEHGYYVDLERVTDSAEMLDLIFQVHTKSWATDSCIRALLNAFEELFRPQANLCSFGESQIIDPGETIMKCLKGQP